MTLGWTLVPEGEYRVNLDASLTPAQTRLLSHLLETFSPPAVSNETQNTTLEQSLRRQLQTLCAARKISLRAETLERLCRLGVLELEGYGPFSPLLADDDLEEIAVVAIGKPVFVCHRKLGWLKTNAVIDSSDFVLQTVNKMARPLGRRLTLEKPRLSAVLSDGSRLHACAAPLAKDGFVMNLRKFRRTRVTLEEMIGTGYLTLLEAAFFKLFFQTDASLLIAGNTASGKTTLLNALAALIPPTERMVLLEESPELCFPHEHQARLVASEHASLEQLVADSLRLRPDRVVVGEVRTAAETRALFDVFLSGQAKGAYGTFHADNAFEALLRLTALGISASDLAALDLVAVCRRGHEGRRLAELCAVENARPVAVFKGATISPAFFSTRLFHNFGQSPDSFVWDWKQAVRSFRDRLVASTSVAPQEP